MISARLLIPLNRKSETIRRNHLQHENFLPVQVEFSQRGRRRYLMKITCLKNDLIKGINIALRAVPAHSTMPILECILIDATHQDIRFITNDMELGIETIVQGSVEESGIVALQAKMFSDIVRKLPDNNVIITVDERCNVYIVCEKSKFVISGLSGEDFAYLPVIERDKSVSISQFTLRQIISQTLFSISSGETNMLMTGELFEIRDNVFRVISLDGHRISIRKTGLLKSYDDMKVIVPGKTLNEISKIMTGEHTDIVEMFITANHILFEMPDTIIVSRLIEGEYFAVDQMISSDYETKIRINRQMLLRCIDRATLFVKEGDKKPIILELTDGNCNISIESPLGAMREDIDIEKQGRDLQIGFNPRFMLEALRAIEDEDITMYMTNAKSPCTIHDDEYKYTYLILPVNFMR